MSQKTIYTCDQCQKPIGEKKHISLSFSNYSGVAVPPVKITEGRIPNLKDFGKPFEVEGAWKVKSSLQGQFKHFCNGVCVGRFFSNLIKITK